jgi:phosphate:Na+ symporter
MLLGTYRLQDPNGTELEALIHGNRLIKAAISTADALKQMLDVLALRERCLKQGNDLPWVERGSILTLLGSAERAFFVIERIDAERRSVTREVRVPAAATSRAPDTLGGAAAVPA